MVSDLVMVARYVPSSTALLPPPMITTSLSRYLAPSHIAHQLIADPLYSSSPGIFKVLGRVPVAIITVKASITSSSSVYIFLILSDVYKRQLLPCRRHLSLL